MTPPTVLPASIGAEGIIYEQMKYCDYWGFERALVSHIMAEEIRAGPSFRSTVCTTTAIPDSSAPACQAFVESLEIKRIRKEGGQELMAKTPKYPNPAFFQHKEQHGLEGAVAKT